MGKLILAYLKDEFFDVPGQPDPGLGLEDLQKIVSKAVSDPSNATAQEAMEGVLAQFADRVAKKNPELAAMLQNLDTEDLPSWAASTNKLGTPDLPGKKALTGAVTKQAGAAPPPVPPPSVPAAARPAAAIPPTVVPPPSAVPQLPVAPPVKAVGGAALGVAPRPQAKAPSGLPELDAVRRKIEELERQGKHAEAGKLWQKYHSKLKMAEELVNPEALGTAAGPPQPVYAEAVPYSQPSYLAQKAREAVTPRPTPPLLPGPPPSPAGAAGGLSEERVARAMAAALKSQGVTIPPSGQGYQLPGGYGETVALSEGKAGYRARAEAGSTTKPRIPESAEKLAAMRAEAMAAAKAGKGRFASAAAGKAAAGRAATEAAWGAIPQIAAKASLGSRALRMVGGPVGLGLTGISAALSLGSIYSHYKQVEAAKKRKPISVDDFLQQNRLAELIAERKSQFYMREPSLAAAMEALVEGRPQLAPNEMLLGGPSPMDPAMKRQGMDQLLMALAAGE